MFAQLHDLLKVRRTTVLLLFLLALGLLGFLLEDLPIDGQSNLALFPDKSPHAREMARNLDMIPLSHLLFVQLESTKSHRANELAKAAEEVLALIPRELAVLTETPASFNPAWLQRLLPGMATPELLQEWETTLKPEAIRAALSTFRQALEWGVSGPAFRWLLEDPLNWRRLVIPNLPLQPSVPAPDPRYGLPISKDGRHLLLILDPRRPLHDVQAASELIETVEKAVSHLPDGITARIVGGHRHSAVNAKTINADIQHTFFLSLLGLALIYLMLVRAWGAVWILLTPVIAVGLATAGVSLFYANLSGLAIGFAASILGVAEDYAVHMHFALRAGRSSSQTLAAMASPLTQGMLLNMAGFGVLLLSSIPALRQMALFAILALLTGWILALTILPLCPGFDKPRQGTGCGPCARTREKTPDLKSSLLLLTLLTAGCCLLAPFFSVDTNFRNLGAGMAEMQQDAEAISAVWGQRNNQLVVVRGNSRSDAFLHVAAAQSILETVFPDISFHSLADILPPDAQQNAQRWRKLLGAKLERFQHDFTAEAAAQGFAPDAFSAFLKEVTALSQASAVTLEDLESLGMGQLKNLFMRESKQDVRMLLLPDQPLPANLLSVDFSPQAMLLSPDQLRDTMNNAFFQEKYLFAYMAIAFISLLLVIFRNLAKVSCMLIPPCCAILCIMLYFAGTGRALNLAGFAALPVVIGLSIDHGVIVLHEHEHAHDFAGPRAVLVSSLTALTSIGILALAKHPALEALGQVIFLGLLGELPAVLWVIPAITRVTRHHAHD